MKKVWYKNSYIIAASLILFFPIGLIWMWAFSTWKKAIKIAITAPIVILFIIGATKGGSTPPASPTEAGDTQVATEPTQQPTATPIPVEKFKVEVSSQIVKKVNKKYRYFFDIRNNDTKNFEGEVTISLYNNKQSSPLGKDTFKANKPIEPDLGNSVYIDINSGPISQHGEYGITKYKYVVSSKGQEVNSGEGEITEKFENLNF